MYPLNALRKKDNAPEIAPPVFLTEASRPRLFSWMEELQAPFVALILEAGSDLRALEFAVLVIGNSKAELHTSERAKGLANGALEIEAALLEIDRDALFTWDAVGCIEERPIRSEETAVRDK